MVKMKVSVTAFMGLIIRKTTSILFLMALLSLHVSCNKKTSTGTFHLDLQLKNLGSLNTTHKIMLVSLQVTGGSQNIIEIFNFCSPENPNCGKFDVEVTAGASQLVQVVLLAENIATGVESIYYGDVRKILPSSSSTQNLRIPVKEIASLEDETRIVGKYVPRAIHPLAGRSLTGRVQLRYKPDNRPSINVHHFEIFGGWFSGPLFTAAKIQYRFEGWDALGRKIGPRFIFNDLAGATNGMDTNSAGLAVVTNRVHRLTLNSDVYYKKEHVDGIESCQPDAESLRPILSGFFGAATGTLCSDSIPTTFSRQIYKDSSCTNAYTGADIVSPGWTLPTSCATGATKIYQQHITDEEDVIGILGPFRFMDGTSKYYQEAVAGATGATTLSWNPLPGANVSSYQVWSLVQENFDFDDVEGPDDVDCSKLAGAGFTLMQSSLASSYAYSADESSNLSNLNIAVCVQDFDGRYYGSVLERRSNDEPSMSPPASFKVDLAYVAPDISTMTVNSNICAKLEVEFLDVNGNRTESQSDIDLQISDYAIPDSSLNGSTNLYQSSEDCSSGTSAMNQLDISRRRSFEIFYKQTSGTYSGHQLKIKDNRGTPSITEKNIILNGSNLPMNTLTLWEGDGTYDPAGDGSGPNQLSIPSRIRCMTFEFVAMDTDGNPSKLMGGGLSTFQYGISGGIADLAANGNFYDSLSECFKSGGTTVTEGTWTTGDNQSSKKIYYRVDDEAGLDAAGPSFTTQVATKAADMPGGDLNGGGPFTVFGPNQLLEFRNMSLEASQFDGHFHSQQVEAQVDNTLCTPIVLTAYSGEHRVTTFPDSLPITVDVALADNGRGINLYSDSACMVTLDTSTFNTSDLDANRIEPTFYLQGQVGGGPTFGELTIQVGSHEPRMHGF